VYEGVRAPAVFTPATINEALDIYQRYPRSVLWAGGTTLMGQLRPYPSHDNLDILYLGNVKELHRISRNERYLEMGSMVPIQRFLAVGQHILHPVLSDACRQLGPEIIRSQSTVGGNLCHPSQRLNIGTALMVLESQVEIRDSQSAKASTRWVPVNRLYKRDGSLGLIHGEIVTRIRVFFEEANFQLFRSLGNPFYHPELAVLFAVFAKYEKSTISEFRFALSFPMIDIIRSKDLETAITSKDLPLSSKEISHLSTELYEVIRAYSTKICSVQKTRACRAFEQALQDLNAQVLMS
jgi:xanthine dehydrogenase FAD-binding subunit